MTVQISFTYYAKRDHRVKALKKLIEQGKYNINEQVLISNLNNFHITKKIRSISSKELFSSFQRRITDVSLQNQAYRSNCIQIKMDILRLRHSISGHIELVRSHLRTEYALILKKEYGTKDAIDRAIDFVLELPLEVMKKLEYVDKYADLIIMDIDKGAFVIKNIIDAASVEKRWEV